MILAALMMSIGWALRGSIGGGPLGAMIPGALWAMAVAHQKGWSARRASLLVGLSALGFGMGGQETYGQSIGLLREVDTRWWGLLGLTLKGAIWGMLAGTIVSLTWLMPARPVRVAVLLLGGSQAGWMFINEPKRIYFSHPFLQPRVEIWAGLGLSALAVLALLRNRMAFRLALFGLIGGGLGFGGGSFFNLVPVAGFPGWKMMEFTFGLVMGGVMWFAVPDVEPEEAPVFQGWHLVSYPLMSAVVIGLEMFLSVRFAYSVAVALMLLVLPRFPQLGWMLGFGVTIAAACVELNEKQQPVWAVVLAIVPVAVLAWWQLKRDDFVRPAMWLLLGVCCWIYCLEYFPIFR
jgi:hypothetical protein